ncbi:MAG: T9SS type A sorting domain-containing protein, partial [Fidelibacterota bacterium]
PNSLEKFVLNSNYPNPFNSNTKIEYSLQNSDKVKLRIYDITGKLVKTLVNENQNSGKYSVNFDGSNLPSGIYLYRLNAENSKVSKTGKMTLLK